MVAEWKHVLAAERSAEHQAALKEHIDSLWEA
jgi:hypothetical protein